MIYLVDVCTRDLTTVKRKRFWRRKTAMHFAVRQLNQTGYGSIIWKWRTGIVFYGPLGHQTEGPASFQVPAQTTVILDKKGQE